MKEKTKHFLYQIINAIITASIIILFIGLYYSVIKADILYQDLPLDLNTINHFRYYSDNKKCFALIGDYVVAVLSDEHANNLEKLKQEASENMAHLLNTPPDFSTYVMEMICLG